MKIGMLTFHRANNLGAVLQAAALCKYLNDKKYDCEIIDFIPNNEVLKFHSLRKGAHIIKSILTINTRYNLLMKEYKFNIFRKKNMKISKHRYYGDRDIERKELKYEVLISGSDQILNTSLTGNSEAYYLRFMTDCKKISYASSFGREDISEYEIKLIKEELAKFDALSVREKSAINIIKKSSGRVAELVLDPVYILTVKELEEISSKKLILK